MSLPPLKYADLSEADVSQQVKDFLQSKQWRVVRHQRTVVPGSFQSGEPGIPDLQAVYYLGAAKPGLTVTLWLEVKSPRDRRTCNCSWRARAKKRGKCGVCLQADWHARERSRGAEVWVCDDFRSFEARYQAAFGWLHSGAVRGQIELALS